MNFEKRLYYLRKSKGFTQQGLAHESKLSETSIKNYESGRRIPSYSIMIRLAEALNVNIEVLVSNEDENRVFDTSMFDLIPKPEIFSIKEYDEKAIINKIDYYREESSKLKSILSLSSSKIGNAITFLSKLELSFNLKKLFVLQEYFFVVTELLLICTECYECILKNDKEIFQNKYKRINQLEKKLNEMKSIYDYLG